MKELAFYEVLIELKKICLRFSDYECFGRCVDRLITDRYEIFSKDREYFQRMYEYHYLCENTEENERLSEEYYYIFRAIDNICK